MNIANDVGYQYDSCRTPFRIGLDWCWNGEPRAQAYVALTSAFFSAIGAHEHRGHVRDRRRLRSRSTRAATRPRSSGRPASAR